MSRKVPPREPTREQIDQSVRYWRRAPQCLDREMTLPIIAALRAAEEREEREERLREALKFYADQENYDSVAAWNSKVYQDSGATARAALSQEDTNDT